MNIEKKVAETIEKYGLVEKKERIAVALSGGKDSTSVLYILNKLGYDVFGLMIDLDLGDWSKIHLRNMEKFCSGLGVELKVVDLKKELGQGICFIKSVLKERKNLTGCAVCGITKKWILNKYSKKFKADKVVTGHNLDDEVQNVLMNFLKGNVFLGVNSGPATADVGNVSSKKNGFVQRVKPLFFVPENEIRKYAKKKKFEINFAKCPCAFGTYRVETREWINSLDLSDKEKLKIVKNFQKLALGLRKNEKNQREIFECKNCGEPCSDKDRICNACKIFSEIAN